MFLFQHSDAGQVPVEPAVIESVSDDKLVSDLKSGVVGLDVMRPLDFLVVSDHAENLGLAPFIDESNPELLKSEWGRTVHDMVKDGDSRGAFQKWLTDAVTAGTDPIDNPKMSNIGN